MTKKIFLKLTGLLMLFSIFSCRQESLLQENENQKNSKNYKVYMLNKKQITSDFALFDKVAKVQNIFTERKNARSVQDSLLDGGIININKVLVVEENGQKTYTFPLNRTFQTNKIENLVLKRNTDSTFSGALVQYDLTSQEKELFNKWHSIDLKSKTKVIDIRNLILNTAARSVSATIGCFTIEYEDGLCNGTQHHAYGDSSCPLIGTSQQAQPPRVLSITAIPGCGNGGGGSGWGTSTPPLDGGFSPNGGGANTIPFSNVDFNYYNSDDMTDPAFQFWYQVSQFMQSQPDNVKQLNALNQYFFYFAHNYFSTHGLDLSTKTIVSERLQFIANWFYAVNSNNMFSYGNYLNESEKELFAVWAFNYFLHHNQNSFNYFKNKIEDLDLIYMDVFDDESIEFANTSADVISDILLANQNNTFNQLNLNWPSLEELKQKIKHAISKGVYTTAKYTRDYVYLPMQKVALKYPWTISYSNIAIDKIRIDAVTPLVNFNPNSMSWGDLFNIWLFELTPVHFSNNTINFTNASNVVNGNNIYNPATNAVKNFPKGNTGGSGILLNIQNKLANGLGIGQTAHGYFHYHPDAFYSTLFNANLGIQMLGSYDIDAKVISKSGNTAVVQFTISNFLGWASGTRFIKGSNGSGNQGIIDDKDVGTGLHLGGTIKNNFTWTETINF